MLLRLSGSEPMYPQALSRAATAAIAEVTKPTEEKEGQLFVHWTAGLVLCRHVGVMSTVTTDSDGNLRVGRQA